VGNPVAIGATNSGGTIASISATTTAAAPVGSVILVALGAQASGTAVSDGTNTYTKVKTQSGDAGGYVIDLWASGVLTAQLPAGTSITATIASSNRNFISVSYVTNLYSATADKTAGASFNGAASGSASTGALGQAAELVIGLVFGASQVTGTKTITEGSGFTSIDAVNGFGDQGSDASYDFAYQVVSSTSSVSYSPSFSGNLFGEVLVASFKYAGAVSAIGSAAASFVGVNVNSGALSSAGSSSVADAGAATAAGTASIAGVASLSLVGAGVLSGALAINGQAVLSPFGFPVLVGVLAVSGQASQEIRAELRQIISTNMLQNPVNCVLAGEQVSFKTGRAAGKALRHAFGE
jgi:hypothetical protein